MLLFGGPLYNSVEPLKDIVKTLCERNFSIIFQSLPLLLVACLHDQTKVAFLKGWLFSCQSEQFEKFFKTSDWLEKSRPSKKATFVLIM